MARIRESYDLSERRACRLLDHPRGTQRYVSQFRLDEDELTQAIIALASTYGRYGYRRITALLQAAGWEVGTDRVERIWRREGLMVPQKQNPKGRLWLNDGSCIRLRPERRNHVWSYDFVEAQTHDGRKLRLMTLIDEFSRECLAIRVQKEPGLWTTANTRSLLGETLLGQQKYAEAERLLLGGYQDLKGREGSIPAAVRQARLSEALGRLVRLYDAWGKKDEAAKWRKEHARAKAKT